jgi:membrane protein DedA with SNARE-associated domain
MHSIFLSYLTLWRPLGYTLTFFGMMFEGDATLFTVAFLTSEGFFDIGDMTVIATASVIIGDILWYFLGRNYISKFPKIRAWADRFAKPVDEHLMDRPFRTLLLTKFAYGTHHATLVRAGMFQMNFRKFIKNDLMAIAIWFPAVWCLGYFGSVSLVYIRRSLRFAEVSLLLGLILFFVVEHFIRKRVRKDLVEDRDIV